MQSKKYSKENFVVEVLSWHNNEVSLNEAEVAAIAAMNPDYNIAKGGTDGNTLALASDERKEEVIGRRKAGLRNAWKNATPEKRKAWGKNIGQAKKGIATRPANYKHSDEVKERIRNSNLTAVKPDGWYENLVAAAQARIGTSNEKRKTPVEIDGVIYNGVADAGKALQVSRQCINRWIKKGKGKYV